MGLLGLIVQHGDGKVVQQQVVVLNLLNLLCLLNLVLFTVERMWRTMYIVWVVSVVAIWAIPPLYQGSLVYILRL